MQDTPFDPSYTLTLVFAAALLAHTWLKFWLASRQIRHVAAHREAVPPLFAASISLAAHHKAADYTIAKTRFGLLDLAWGVALTLGWTLLSGLSTLNALLVQWMGTGLFQQVALVAAFTLINGLLELPFSLYMTFVLEQRFGFNKMTPALWLQDTVKSLVLGAIIGLPLLALFLWLMGATGPLWWLWIWGAWMAFNLLAMVIYPTWIAPWFNRFEPLQDAELVQRVTALMQRCGFHAKGLFVMDGSKRSAHANAYFTGFGAAKRVVFYDTLLKQLDPGEVDAVLAHELGHFKHRHVTKRIIMLFGVSFFGFAALGWLSGQIWFYTGLGVLPLLDGPNDGLALLLAMMLMPMIGGVLRPLLAQVSRRDEFQADAYAIAQTRGQDLASALLKLYKDNAATLTPDPLFVRYYYSHPPATERLARMSASYS